MKPPGIQLTKEVLSKFLHYNFITGGFKKHNKKYKESSVSSLGCLVISLNGKQYLASRLAFVYMENREPELLVDHVNRNKLINTWINLREVNRVENANNKATPHRDSKVKSLGVSEGRGGKFRARIFWQGAEMHLGGFKTEEEAFTAYKRAKEIYHKEVI